MSTVAGPYAVGACLLSLLLLFALVATPLFSAADTPPSPQPNRLRSLDGVRGFLALGVFFHHATIYHRYLIDSTWQGPPSRFFTALGPVAVNLFFMITAYLFWSRLLREQGRPAWLNLYIGRIFRIGPLFFLAFTGMALIALERTGFHLLVPPAKLASQLLHVVGLGFFQTPEINHYLGTSLLLDDVPWTLQFEWLFYLLLPVFAVVVRRTHHSLAVVSVLAASVFTLQLVHPAPPSQLPSFHSPTIWLALLMGMLTASLLKTGLAARLRDNLSSALIVLLLTAVVLGNHLAHSLSILALGIVFYLLTSGCSFFGLLLSRPARRLGDISFGIYLLQGFTQAFVYRPHFLRAFTLSSFWAFWLMTLIAAVLLLMAATICHVWIERPGIALGRLCARRFHHLWTSSANTLPSVHTQSNPS